MLVTAGPAAAQVQADNVAVRIGLVGRPSTPFLDFRSTGDNDYDVRIYAQGGLPRQSGAGGLNIVAGGGQYVFGPTVLGDRDFDGLYISDGNLSTYNDAYGAYDSATGGAFMVGGNGKPQVNGGQEAGVPFLAAYGSIDRVGLYASAFDKPPTLTLPAAGITARRITPAVAMGAADVAKLRRRMYVMLQTGLNGGHPWSSWITGWDAAGRWVDVIGWAQLGGGLAAPDQVPTGLSPPGQATVYVNPATNLFGANVQVECGTASGGRYEGGAASCLATEVDVINNAADYRRAGISSFDARGVVVNNAGRHGIAFGYGCQGGAAIDACVEVLSYARNGLFFSDTTGGLTGTNDLSAAATADGAALHSWQHAGLFINLNPDGGRSVFAVDAAGNAAARALTLGPSDPAAPGPGRVVTASISSAGDLEVALPTPRAAIHTNGGLMVEGAALLKGRLQIAQHTPGSSAEPCSAGEIAWDARFTYVCVRANTWRRSPLEAF